MTKRVGPSGERSLDDRCRSSKAIESTVNRSVDLETFPLISRFIGTRRDFTYGHRHVSKVTEYSDVPGPPPLHILLQHLTM